MAVFQYKAKDHAGNDQKGSLEAENLSTFFEKLEEEGLYCLQYNEVTGKTIEIKTNFKIPVKELVIFCKKLSTMLSAGINIVKALEILCANTYHKKAKKKYLTLYESVRGGNSLSIAMKETEKAFPLLLINMIEAGEESGNMDIMLSKMADYYQKQVKINSKIKTATMYPKILITVSILVILILFSFVLPKVFETLQNDNLPTITKIMMAISNSLSNHWYIWILLIAFAIFGSKMILKVEKVRLFWDSLTLKIPIVGTLLKKIYSARFASTLAILYSSGLSILNGIRLTRNVINNKYIEHVLGNIAEEASSGRTISSAIGNTETFDTLLPSMIKIGEETGNLDFMLESTADYYDQETEAAIEKLLTILEPVLLVVLAIVIGAVLISVMLPIFQSYSAIKA